MAENFVPQICGENDVFLPETGCDDCSKLEARVNELEACCEEVRAEIPKKLEVTNLHNGDHIVITTSGNDITVSSDIEIENYYNKSEVNEMIDNLESITFKPVDELPDVGEPRIIYLVPSSPGSDDHSEYIWFNNRWELIGHTSVDMSDYYTKVEVDNLLEDKQDKLTAGEYITLDNDTVSLDLTKDDILFLLGYEEAEITMIGEDDSVITTTVLVKADASA